MREEHGSDVCYCGDYRSEHGPNGCGPCGLNPSFLERCTEFRWGRKATAEEQAHWNKYYAKHAALEGK